jgi:hypothetical protein
VSDRRPTPRAAARSARDPAARLEALGGRIERLSLDPDAIEAQTLFRVARPILAIAGWRARVGFRSMRALVETLRTPAPLEPSPRQALDAAIDELERNVTTVERVAIVKKRPPVAHGAWLRRVWELCVLAERAVESLEAGSPDADAIRRAARPDESALFPPLALERAGERPKDAKPDEAKAPADGFVDVPTRDEAPAPDADVRVVELELAAIDHLLAAARAERGFLGRRRRLLVAARQALLESSAALPLDRAGVRERSSYIAREIARIDRLETVGLDPGAGLVHQARMAATRGDTRRLYAALAALDAGAIANGDGRVAQATSRAIGALWGGEDPANREAIEASLQRSAVELLGAAVAEEIARGIGEARYAAETRAADARSPAAKSAALAEVADHFHEGAERQLLHAAVAVDGCFEVGGALSPVRIVEEERVVRQVRHPTQHLVLVPAHDVHDVPDAIIADPRTILLDLAAGRLLARRFVREEVARRTRVARRSEVRVYVLDGSGSMKGPRARVRDAILVAELATLIARLSAPGDTRCTLFFRYFDEELGPVTRVDSIAAARKAVRDVVGTARYGGTDIQRALVASLDQIETARQLDPELARAQIVLVTDGEAALVAARARIQGVPVGVSVIALGQENPALRGIVARQRARGEAAFYHFLDDAELEAIASGALDGGLPVHLPDGPKRSPQALAQEIEREIGPVLDELESIEKERDVAALETLDDEARARREVGLDETANEGDRARIEALHRDRTALAARFARWFPEPARGGADGGAPVRAVAAARTTNERDDVDATLCALAAVAEVVTLLGGSELARRTDAIDLIERLLPDARLTPARYRAVLRDHGATLAPALRAVHDAVRTGA